MSEPRVPDFHDLVGDEGSPEELARLRRAHDLLVEAGPPPELSPRLQSAPDVGGGVVRLRPRRRLGAALVLAAALLAAAFAAGYYVRAPEEGFRARFTAAMRGIGQAEDARASIAVGERDNKGNTPLELKVWDLEHARKGDWYELYLTKQGKPKAQCGTFLAAGDETTIRLTIPWRLDSKTDRYDGWVVIVHHAGERGVGAIMLRTNKI
jgi:hypothetical protein